MATKTLNVTLGLSTTSTINGIFTLNASESDAISYDDTAASSATITVATGSASQLVDKTVVTSKSTYVYIKNLDTTNFVALYTDDANLWGKILPGEFAFFPVAPGAGFEVKADTAACVVEYALFEQP
tara:strand:- start:1132 stop:1512 length:381 start_codon:yes stop_codon:yes gene_type:complete